MLDNKELEQSNHQISLIKPTIQSPKFNLNNYIQNILISKQKQTINIFSKPFQLTKGKLSQLMNENQILVLEFIENNKDLLDAIIIPVYIRTKIQSINNVDIVSLNANLNVTIYLSIYCGPQKKGLDRNYIKNRINIRLKQSGLIYLAKAMADETKGAYAQQKTFVKLSETNQLLNYQINTQVNTCIICDAVFAPLQSLIMPIQLQINYDKSCELSQNPKTNPKRKQLYFNIMNSINNPKDEYDNIKRRLYIDRNTHFGYYDVGEKKIEIKLQSTLYQKKIPYDKARFLQNEYLPNYENMDQQEERLATQNQQLLIQFKMMSYNIYQLNIFLYRKPISFLLKLTVPLILLSFLNLCIFFQSNDISGRISSNATIMIAFTAFLPVLRDQIPYTPNLTISEIQIMLECLKSLLVMIQSLSIYKINNYQFDWKSDTIFMISLIITIVNVFVLLLTIIYHYAYRQNFSNMEFDEELFKNFHYQDWKNQQFRQQLNKEIDKLLYSLKSSDQGLFQLRTITKESNVSQQEQYIYLLSKYYQWEWVYLYLESDNSRKNTINQKMTKIELSNYNISKMDCFGDFPHLKHLHLSSNKIKKIQNLSNNKSTISPIQYLNLGINYITKLQCLSTLSQLQTFIICYNLFIIDDNQITQIQNLDSLVNLKHLILNKNYIVEILGLQKLKMLNTLDISQNKIAKINNLKQLKQLKVLRLGFNSITQIENLQSLLALEKLQLHNNLIEQIKNVNHFPSLQVLGLGNKYFQQGVNRIKEIKNLEGLTNLTQLYLEKNKITHLKNLQHLSKLKKIWLNQNPLLKTQQNSLQVQILRRLFKNQCKL